MPTSELLKHAVSELEKLPVEDQNAFAARWLEEIRDERAWAGKFDATTDEQWGRLAALAKGEVTKGDTIPLDDFLDEAKFE